MLSAECCELSADADGIERTGGAISVNLMERRLPFWFVFGDFECSVHGNYLYFHVFRFLGNFVGTLNGIRG